MLSFVGGHTSPMFTVLKKSDQFIAALPSTRCTHEPSPRVCGLDFSGPEREDAKRSNWLAPKLIQQYENSRYFYPRVRGRPSEMALSSVATRPAASRSSGPGAGLTRSLR